MVPAEFYQIFYLLLVSFLTILILQKYCIGGVCNVRVHNDSNFALILALLLSIIIGLRPISIVFVDMITYSQKFDFLSLAKPDYLFNTDNLIYDNMVIFLAVNNLPKDLFFLLMSTIYFLGTFFALKKIFPNNVLISYLVWLAALSTFSYAVNGLKAGVAATLFLVAIGYKKNKIKALFFLFLSIGFHHSMIVCIVAYIMASFFKNTKFYLFFWLFCLVIALLHITYFQFLFGSMADEQGGNYLLTTGGAEFGGKGGFRFDFIIYSLGPVLIGYWLIYKKRIESEVYRFMLNIYLATNGIWLLCMYASFTNRIAYLSWLMLPIVLIYPFIETGCWKKRYIYFRRISIIHLLFTLFMILIYY